MKTLYLQYDERQYYRITEQGHEMVNLLGEAPLIIRTEDAHGGLLSSHDLRRLWSEHPDRRLTCAEYEVKLAEAMGHPDVKYYHGHP